MLDRKAFTSAEGAILPAKTNPPAYNRENYPGHTLYRGNIELTMYNRRSALRISALPSNMPVSRLCVFPFLHNFKR